MEGWIEIHPGAGNRVEAFYFKLYCERWGDDEVRKVMASIPTLMKSTRTFITTGREPT